MATGTDPYVDFGYRNSEPLSCAECVFPVLLELAEPVRPGARVLDVGCGNGALAEEFVARGCAVVGIDLARSGIVQARKRCPTARFEVLPADERMRTLLDEPPFDLVVSTEVIEHLYAPLAFLAGAFEALRLGGHLILSTPYHGYLKNVAVSVTGRFDTHVQSEVQGGHIKFWSRRTLSRALVGAGFEQLQFRGAGRAPFLWKAMLFSAKRPG